MQTIDKGGVCKCQICLKLELDESQQSTWILIFSVTASVFQINIHELNYMSETKVHVSDLHIKNTSTKIQTGKRYKTNFSVIYFQFNATGMINVCSTDFEIRNKDVTKTVKCKV